MHPAELVRGFIADLLRLPLVFKLGLLYAAGAAVWNWRKKQKQAAMVAASEAWPVYRARVVWAQVLDRESKGEGGPSYWPGLLTYSYTVPGHEIEIGEFRKVFNDEEEADAWARSLRDTHVDVRVDPSDPKRSVWQESPAIAPRFAAPVMDAQRAMEAGSFGLKTGAAALVFCISTAGALVSAWIQISCIRGTPVLTVEKNTTAFFGLHIAVIVCAFAAGALHGKRGMSGWGSGLKSFSDASTGVQLVKILGTYASAVFFYGWVRSAAHDGGPCNWTVLMFSAAWLVGFAASALNSLRSLQGDNAAQA
jgi:Protein of unknown function (DUF3592)